MRSALIVSIALAACGVLGSNDLTADATPTATADVVTADATAEAPDTSVPLELPYFEGQRYVLPGSHANVVKRMRFTALVEPGVALGFDLDSKVSEEGEVESCGHGDLLDPEGNAGIDNQLAKIWSDLQPLVGTQVDALLQGAINEGRVLLMFELEGMDDLKNDDSVTLNVFRGLLDPDVGTFGYIAPDQSFDYDYEKPISTVENVQIVDG